MRLSLIYELKYGKAIRQMQPLLGVMPQYKIDHSIRVGRRLHKAGAGKRGAYAGLLHDYLERGGDIETLSQHIGDLGLPQEIARAVHALSSEDGVDPLAHMQEVLPTIKDDDLRNLIILCKISDRLDKIRQRTSGKFQKKSRKLISYLASKYTGELRPLKNLLNKYRKWT